MDKQEQADEAHKQFRGEGSDFLSYLKLWDFFHGHAEHLSGSKMRKLCKENFLSYVRMREWHDIHNQLKEIVGEMGLVRKDEGGRMKEERKRLRPS
jgi:ATP-dependent helicase HrpA